MIKTNLISLFTDCCARSGTQLDKKDFKVLE